MCSSEVCSSRVHKGIGNCGTIKNERVESTGFVSKNSRTKTHIWNVLIRDLFTRLVKKTVAAQQCMVSWDCCVMAESEGLSVEVVDEAISTNGDPDTPTRARGVSIIDSTRVIEYGADHRDEEVLLFILLLFIIIIIICKPGAQWCRINSYVTLF